MFLTVEKNRNVIPILTDIIIIAEGFKKKSMTKSYFDDDFWFAEGYTLKDVAAFLLISVGVKILQTRKFNDNYPVNWWQSFTRKLQVVETSFYQTNIQFICE